MSLLNDLTDRELQIFARLFRGEKPKEIARGLELSDTTVYMHINRVYLKLGIKNKNQLTLIQKFSNKILLCRRCLKELEHDSELDAR